MKILFISEMLPYFPCFDGFRLIPYSLIKELSKKHEIHLLAFYADKKDRERTDSISRYCKSLDMVYYQYPTSFLEVARNVFSRYSSSPEMSDRIEQSFKKENFDLIHVEGAHMGQYVMGIKDIPKIVCPHDSPSANAWQQFKSNKALKKKLKYLIEIGKRRYIEKRIYAQFNHCVVVSEKDKEAIQRHAPGLEVTVMTNGVDLDYYGYRPYGGPENNIIFTGTMSYAPNVDAALFFYHEIFPMVRERIPNVKLYIVGASPGAEILNLKEDPAVVVTGRVDDIRDYIYQSAIYVCPMRYGTGIKNKVLEAMAMGVPVVATPASIAGIPAVDGEHISLTGTPDAFARETIRLLEDKMKRARMTGNARKLVEAHFNWADRAKMIEDIYRRIT
ncbi:MAG: glycosyltransferase [Candidatus Omnitrophica bacterium]|nr:glycosyltransferase [Candidatus Omnitrophota bacterium]